MNRRLMIRILELLEETYPEYYSINRLIKKLNVSIDGEFSKIIQYLGNKKFINIAYDDSNPYGDVLTSKNKISIIPDGIDFLLKIKEIEIDNQRNKITAGFTKVLALAAFLQIIFYIISKDFSLNATPNNWLTMAIILLIAIFLIGIMTTSLVSSLCPNFNEFWRDKIKKIINKFSKQ